MSSVMDEKYLPYAPVNTTLNNLYNVTLFYGRDFYIAKYSTERNLRFGNDVVNQMCFIFDFRKTHFCFALNFHLVV